MTVFLWQFFDESLKEHLEVFLLGRKKDAETFWVVMIMECVLFWKWQLYFSFGPKLGI